MLVVGCRLAVMHHYLRLHAVDVMHMLDTSRHQEIQVSYRKRQDTFTPKPTLGPIKP